VFLVDGFFVRNHIDIDFTNGAHQLSRPYVPEGEIWLDRPSPRSDELELFTFHQLEERKAMLMGADYLEALVITTQRERRLRRQRRGLAGVRVRAAHRETVRRRRLAVRNGTPIWLVYGCAVRDLFDPDFTLGGHDRRYSFIPRNEIWIDDAVLPREREAIVVHEVTEHQLMVHEGLSYVVAHEHASNSERRVRRALVRRIGPAAQRRSRGRER
jgi:hypothetical protein